MLEIDENRLSKIILSARKRLNITQSEVSAQTGITQGTLSKIESFQCSVSAKNWFLLSKLLDIPSDSIWTGFIDRGIKPSVKTQKNVFKLPKRYFNNAFSSVKEIIPTIQYICEKFGTDQYNMFLKKVKVSELIFIDLNNKINFLFLCDLLEHFYGENLNTDTYYEIVKLSKVRQYHGVHSNQYKKKSSSIGLLKAFLDNASYYQDAYSYKILEKSSKSLSFEMTPLDTAKENIEETKDIYIPFKKSFIESFSKFNDSENIQLTLKENLTLGNLHFRAIATST